MRAFSYFLLGGWICFLSQGQLELRKDKPANFALQTVESVQVVLATICRNEAVNFRANLALWTSVVKYFVFIMDERNTDDSSDVIREELEGRAQGYKIIANRFEGFGAARTASLSAAWKYYPQATHVLIADPDWRPQVDSLHLSDLVYNTAVFRFEVEDRNGHTTRNVDWLLRNRPGLRMRYALHEVLDIGWYDATVIRWRAEEVERHGTWHADSGHGHSMSLQRYAFDLDMLYKDFAAYPQGLDPHVNYYLGVTHSAYVNNLEATIFNNTGRVNVYDDPDARRDIELHRGLAIGNSTLRVLVPYREEFLEQKWGAMFVIAKNLERRNSAFLDIAGALSWYYLCHDFGQGRQTECLRAAVVLAYENGDLAVATTLTMQMLRVNPRRRLMLNSRYEVDCNVPAIAAVVLAEGLHTEQRARAMERAMERARAMERERERERSAQMAEGEGSVGEGPQGQSQDQDQDQGQSLGLGLGALALYVQHLRGLSMHKRCISGGEYAGGLVVGHTPLAALNASLLAALRADGFLGGGGRAEPVGSGVVARIRSWG